LRPQTEPRAVDSATAAQPSARVGTPADIAEAIAYLIRASSVTGVVVPVEGGLVMG
jgi:NAD(P)-dependent dehydrogenase (short-subunit alcohol dehydrogenase family)